MRRIWLAVLGRIWPPIVGLAGVGGYAVVWFWCRSQARGFHHFLASDPNAGSGGWLLWPLPYLFMALVTVAGVVPVGAAVLLVTTPIWPHRRLTVSRRRSADGGTANAGNPAEYGVADLLDLARRKDDRSTGRDRWSR